MARAAYYDAVRNMDASQEERTKKPLSLTDKGSPLMCTARRRWIEWKRLESRNQRAARQSGIEFDQDGSLIHHRV